MPMMKYAHARVVTPNVGKTEWRNIRTASSGVIPAELSDNLMLRASDFFGTNKFNPDMYLLTHATIIASVDSYSPVGQKTGSLVVDGFKVNRKYSNFRIKPETDQYINNNGDSWDRAVLLKSFRTFIGGHNFVEHVQVEELSKGRIIDAVARDIGDSIYVDILIATDRKHTDLIKDIESGRMATLSMGTTVDHTTCTKCGNVAADETEMCGHIRFEKGNKFFDENGTQHRVAELCGHSSVSPTGGCHFIEASWVKTPAFTGAVLRNVLKFDQSTAKKAQRVMATPPTEWSPDANIKAASGISGHVIYKEYTTKPKTSFVITSDDSFFAGWEDDGSGEAPVEDGGGEQPAAPEAPKAPFQDVEDEVYNQVKDRIRNRFKTDMAPPSSTVPVSTNETLNKQSAFGRVAYTAALNTLVKIARSDAELIDSVATYNRSVGITGIPVEIYRVALAAGPTTNYNSVSKYQMVCNRALKRAATEDEFKTLVRLGKLLSRRTVSKQ